MVKTPIFKTKPENNQKITLVHERSFMIQLATFLQAACLKEHTFND